MDFVSIRVITDDVARLAAFYERATGVQASWSNENFAELTVGSATLAIASARTVRAPTPGTRSNSAKSAGPRLAAALNVA